MNSATYIYLNTSDAVNGTTNPADALFQLSFENRGDNKSFVSLEQATIPLTQSPVNSNNNTLVLEENIGAATTTVTLSNQAYTGGELAVELKSKLDAASGLNTFTVTYNGGTKKITIVASSTNFRFASSSTALKVIGFAANESYATTHVSSSVVRLDGSLYYDIISSFSSRNVSSDGRSNVLARIPLVAAFGSVQTYQLQNDSRVEVRNRDLDIISVYLTDDEGRRVSLPEFSDISYVFKLSVA